MGQAKNRGTREQRVEQAKERIAREGKAFEERMEAERQAERERLIAARLAGHDVVVPRPRGKSRIALLAALALASASMPQK